MGHNIPPSDQPLSHCSFTPPPLEFPLSIQRHFSFYFIAFSTSSEGYHQRCLGDQQYQNDKCCAHYRTGPSHWRVISGGGFANRVKQPFLSNTIPRWYKNVSQCILSSQAFCVNASKLNRNCQNKVVPLFLHC